MRISTSMRWLVVVAGAAMLLAVAAACAGETVEVPASSTQVGPIPRDDSSDTRTGAPVSEEAAPLGEADVQPPQN